MNYRVFVNTKSKIDKFVNETDKYFVLLSVSIPIISENLKR